MSLTQIESDAQPIDFHRPTRTGAEEAAFHEALAQSTLSGDGPFSRRASEWLRAELGAARVLLTPSATHALELSALVCGVGAGDEVIMPSYTFVSTANAFVLFGATPVFVDIDPATMNLDPSAVAAAVTERTRAIVPVHYGGVGCDMAAIQRIADTHGLLVIEDAAQAIGAHLNGRPLGGFGDMACFSFHATKNIHCGEGGALVIRDERWIQRAEVIREKGTDRSRMIRGEVDKYTWLDRGSSYLLSDLNAAVLWAQLQHLERVTAKRRALWTQYQQGLAPLAEAGRIELASPPAGAMHNAHLFYLKTADGNERHALTTALAQQRIAAARHYVPLHSSPGGQRFGRLAGDDRYTTRDAERLLRLPVHTDLRAADVDLVVGAVRAFYGG